MSFNDLESLVDSLIASFEIMLKPKLKRKKEEEEKAKKAKDIEEKTISLIQAVKNMAK